MDGRTEEQKVEISTRHSQSQSAWQIKRVKIEGEELCELAIDALHDRDEATAHAVLRKLLAMEDTKLIKCLRAVLKNLAYTEPWLSRAVLRFENNVLPMGVDASIAELTSLFEANPQRPFELVRSAQHPIARLDLEPRRLIQHELEQYLGRDCAGIVVQMLPFAIESFHLRMRLLFPAPMGDEEFASKHLSWVEHEVVDINSRLQVIALQQVKINNAQRDVIDGHFANLPDESGPKVWISVTCDWFLRTTATIEQQSERMHELENDDTDNPARTHWLQRYAAWLWLALRFVSVRLS